MKKVLLFTVLLLFTICHGYSQNVNGLLFDATNTNTRDQSAAFEINANTNTPGSPLYGGFLMPRVALTGTTDVTTIAGTEATSLIVYNTATVSNVTPGFYYWLGAPTNAWQRIIAGNSTFPTGTGTPNYLARWITGSTLGIGVTYDNGTNVGISSATPGARLDVIGPATGSGPTLRAGGGGDVVLASGGTLFFDDNYSYAGGNYIRPIGGVNTQGFFTAGSERMRILANGNVGVNITAPIGRLDVQGPTARTGTHATSPTFYVSGTLNTGQTGPAAGNVEFRHDNGTQGIGFGYNTIYQAGSNTNQDLNFLSKGNSPITLNAFAYSTGNVGIATTLPGWKLDVNGNARVGANASQNTLGALAVSAGQGSATRYRDIDIHGSWAGSEEHAITWSHGSAAADMVAQITARHTSPGSSLYFGRLYHSGNSTFDAMELRSTSATAADLYLPNGNVGISTTVPGGRLDVYGDIFGVNEYSFQGCAESIKDWDYSGLNNNPGCNSASDDSWWIQSNSTNWDRGVLSKRRFTRTPGLTLEYEAYMQDVLGAVVHYMIGFVDGNSTSYSYNQNPANLMYHDNAQLSVYDNGGAQGSSYNVDTRNAWYKFKVVLKGAGANYYVFHNGSWRLVRSTANNSNKYVRVMISAYHNRMHIRNMRVYQGDLNNQDVAAANTAAAQTIAWNAGGTEISMGSYPTVYKGDNTATSGSANLIMASVNVSGNDIRFANGVGGYQQVQALAHGVASFTVELQRRINGGGWTALTSQSAVCGLSVGDYYMQYNGIVSQAVGGGISGDMYRFPNSVSISYFDSDPTVGSFEYRLVFTPSGYNKNGGSYLLNQRTLNVLQIKR